MLNKLPQRKDEDGRTSNVKNTQNGTLKHDSPIGSKVDQSVRRHGTVSRKEKNETIKDREAERNDKTNKDKEGKRGQDNRSVFNASLVSDTLNSTQNQEGTSGLGRSFVTNGLSRYQTARKSV